MTRLFRSERPGGGNYLALAAFVAAYVLIAGLLFMPKSTFMPAPEATATLRD